MIEGVMARVTTMECERGAAYWDIGFRPMEIVMGPWKSKVTIEFPGPIPEWLVRAVQENGGCVKVIP